MGMRTLPPVAAMTGLARVLAGRVHFDRKRIGQVLVVEDGERHRIFREVRVDPARKEPSDPPVTLTLRFRFARFSPAANRRLSLIPIPAIIGMPGFLGKTWTHCEKTGISQGIYRFESLETAAAYLASPVVRILERRAAPGSMGHSILHEEESE